MDNRATGQQGSDNANIRPITTLATRMPQNRKRFVDHVPEYIFYLFLFVDYSSTIIVARPYNVESMNDNLERIWKEAVVTQSTYYAGIFPEGLKEIAKYFIQDSRCPGRDTSMRNT
jgi:hypothetical protein